MPVSGRHSADADDPVFGSHQHHDRSGWYNCCLLTSVAVFVPDRIDKAAWSNAPRRGWVMSDGSMSASSDAPSAMPFILLALTFVIPLTGWLVYDYVPAVKNAPEALDVAINYPWSPGKFQKRAVGDVFNGHPRICHVQITRLQPDGPVGTLICDAGSNTVSFCHSEDSQKWHETVLLQDVIAPAHATVVDIDSDGDLDILVAALGNIEPDDGVIGSIVLLENLNNGYRPITILDDVRRVADVQAGDFDGDGDLDLAVAVFGYNRGQVLWLEQTERLRFLDHELLSAPGTIHVPVADFDRDGDLDIAAIVTQDEEELWAFENLGKGKFSGRRLWFTHNFDLGSAGLVADDLDNDGDVDLILPAGDNLEDFDPFPQPYHGCFWFENDGDWRFRPHRISDFGGTYAAATGDIDGDNDKDVVLVSMANVWDDPDRASVLWLENNGQQEFTPWKIDTTPTHLVTVATGDLNGDGILDVAAGGLHIRGPYDRLGRVTAWFGPEESAP